MSDVLSDAELVRAARAGEPAGLGALLERHRAGMLAVAVGQLGHTPEAEDAVHDAVLVALQRLGDLRDPAAVRPWLHAIVRNACRRRRRGPGETTVPDPARLPLRALAPSPEEVLERHALRDWVWQALAELSAPLRAVTVLRYFSHGASSYEAIAALCGIPVGTVRSRLNQARRKLADALLATAAGAHDDAAAVGAAQRRAFAALFRATESGRVGPVLAELWWPDVELVAPGGAVARGLEVARRVVEADRAAGVRYRLDAVVAGRDLVLVEGAFLNPADDPDHCPPGFVWLQTLEGGRGRRVRVLYAARDGGGGDA
jgi:RNA polymerase sigma-70 factor (ECF subfamily)